MRRRFWRQALPSSPAIDPRRRLKPSVARPRARPTTSSWCSRASPCRGRPCSARSGPCLRESIGNYPPGDLTPICRASTPAGRRTGFPCPPSCGRWWTSRCRSALRPPAHAFRGPTEAEIERARERVGYGHLHSRRDPPALRKDIPGLRIDVNSLGPGYTVDRIAAALDRAGIRDYLVELGGAVRARGQRPGGGAWRVAIEKPLKTNREALRVVELTTGGLSTAGDYREYFDQEGRRYSHILDPATGRPITHALTSVSVIAPNAVTADAWDTALMAMGPARGRALALRLKMPVLFVVRAESARNGFEVLASPQFEPYLRPGEPRE